MSSVKNKIIQRVVERRHGGGESISAPACPGGGNCILKVAQRLAKANPTRNRQRCPCGFGNRLVSIPLWNKPPASFLPSVPCRHTGGDRDTAVSRLLQLTRLSSRSSFPDSTCGLQATPCVPCFPVRGKAAFSALSRLVQCGRGFRSTNLRTR